MRKIGVCLVAAYLLLPALSPSAFAGGLVFRRLHGGHHLPPKGLAFFHHRGFGPLPFFHLGRFGSPWRPHFRGYRAPPAVLLYPESSRERFGPKDPSGGLYVEGYRVRPAGWLRVEVEPADAEVTVDGFPVAIGRVSGSSGALGFPVGLHAVAARKPGFRPYESRVAVEQARESVVRVLLRRQEE